MGINLTSNDTRPIKATRTALEIIKANEKSIKNSITGKVTAVVAIMKIFSKNFSNFQNDSSGRLNLKKKHRNSAESHQIGLNEPAKDVSKGLIVKEKTMGTT